MRLWTRAMPVGFQPIREFPGISRCWDVEDQRSLVLCCGGSISHFWRRQMPLRQTNLVEISDLRVLCFGSVFRFLVQSFTPSLIHTSYPGPNSTWGTPKMTSKQKTTGTNSELSLNLNASYTICQTKRPTFGPKAKVRQFLVLFLDIIFLTEFFPSASGASRKRPAWKTPEAPRRPHPLCGRARQRPGVAALPPRGSGARARERFNWPAASKEWLNCLFRWCCGWKVPEEDPTFSSLVLAEILTNVGMFGFELPDY